MIKHVNVDRVKSCVSFLLMLIFFGNIKSLKRCIYQAFLVVISSDDKDPLRGMLCFMMFRS